MHRTIFLGPVRLTFSTIAKAKGISSLCDDGKHIHMMDFDNKDERILIDELLTFQSFFNLSHIYVFKTRNKGYHGYCLEKALFNDIFYRITKLTSIDTYFLIFTAKRHKSTLRVTPRIVEDKKISFIKYIHSFRNSKSEGSLAHRVFLEEVLKVPKEVIDSDPLKFDNDLKLDCVKYETGV